MRPLRAVPGLPRRGPVGVGASLVAAATMVASAAALAPTTATAQLADEVAATRDGQVRFVYPTRPGVEICDDGVHRSDDGQARFHRGDRGTCWTDGRARVELRVEDGVVRRVHLLRPSEMDGGAGLVTASGREAAGVLLSIAREGGSARAAKEAVFPAVVADVPDVWRELASLAQDRGVDRETRKAALFWLGQEAADAVTAELSDVALSSDEDQEVREAAIFALSQRPAEQAIDALMEVGLQATDGESRRQAMFWLAQFDDPRVVSFFQDVLSGRAG